MRIIPVIAIFLLIQIKVYGQVITGRVADSKTNEPLEYVSIGIIDTNFGTITDSTGYFRFEAKVDELSIVRISMIGFKPQKFTVKDLQGQQNEIKLDEKTFELTEVIIKPTKERKVGALRPNRFSGWSGWGGEQLRRGFEIGIKLDLGEKPIKIKSLNVLLKRQSFDRSLFRLHIRSIKDTLILDELLTENIVFSISKESGWIEIDLEPYNIILSDKVGVTLEWLDVFGNNPDRAITINKKMSDAYILFKNSKKHFGLYRWGTEAKWMINKKQSPSMYMTIME
jgi:hypothetical protein